jgi:hypothetical protein
MKRLWFLLLIIPATSFGQIGQPDTLKLTDKELFGESGNLNNVGVLQSYVNFSKDVLSTSNI